MDNVIAIVTGGNRGIGRETVTGLAEKKYTVIMACRDVAGSSRVCSEIKEMTGNENVFVMKLDVSSKKAITEFVAAFAARFGKVNILVNNAGISSSRRQETVDGIELNIGTNYFGTFLLTYYLLPYFEKNADNRIINMTSYIYKNGSFKINRINRYHWVKAYAVSKYMILLFTLELAEYTKGTTIKVNAVHPGIVRTRIMYNKKWYDFIIKLLLLPFFVEPHEGAETGIYLATSDEVRNVSGKYFVKCRERTIPAKYNDISMRKELWAYSVAYASEKSGKL
jgi:NAD(P)-dependent dehydrogenase (short-subunit alcohol dehydrogenase family)